MTEKAMLKPRAGAYVLCPATGLPLAAQGELKPLTTYWLRRMRKGEVTRVAPAPAKKKAAKSAPEKEG